MSRGHDASRRRNYRGRQSELRDRSPQPVPDLDAPVIWPRGAAWEDRPAVARDRGAASIDGRLRPTGIGPAPGLAR
jgi:hypothetical protein